MMSEAKTLVTKGKTLITEGRTLVTKVKPLVEQGTIKELGEGQKYFQQKYV